MSCATQRYRSRSFYIEALKSRGTKGRLSKMKKAELAVEWEPFEAEKRRSWDAPMLRRAEAAPAGVEFIPFSLEVSGVCGPASARLRLL